MSSASARSVLASIEAQLGIEPQWLVRGDDRLEWWPGPFCQRLWVQHGEAPRLHIESDFFRDVPETDKTLGLIALANKRTTFSALVLRDSTVRLHASFSVTQHNAEAITRLVLIVAAAQAADAHIKAPGLAPVFDSVADQTPHPLAGTRKDGHTVLHTLLMLHDENDIAPNAAELDFSPMEKLDPRPWVMAFAGVGGMSAELPFTGTQPSLFAALEGHTRLETALFQATTDMNHAQLGHGVLVRLTLPAPKGNPTLANLLNLMEASGKCAFGVHQLGAWCSHDDSLVFATFVPSVMFELDLLECFVRDAARRAAWARDLLVGVGV